MKKSQNQQKQAQRGRPKNPETLASIMAAANTLFFTKGYSGVSMDAIAKEAGLSRVTVYSYFANKETLFKQLLIDIADNTENGTGEAALNPHNDLREELIKFGMKMAEFILREDIIRTCRVIISQAEKFPKLTRLFYEAGPERTGIMLAAFLEKHPDFECDDYQLASDRLRCLWMMDDYMKSLHTLETKRSLKQFKADIADVVDFFLNGYRIKN